jgi:hypothetical protein
MEISKIVFRSLKNSRFLNIIILRPFYFIRFVYYSIKENSTWFYRYYPGYHGSTIPSLKYINSNRKRLFFDVADIDNGIELNRENQKMLLKIFSRYFEDFSPSNNPSSGKLYFYNNDKYGFNDAFILYCIFRHYRPMRVIEVGSGYSSALMLDISKDILPDTHFTFIDPYSTTIEKFIKTNPVGNYQLIQEEVQNIELGIYSALRCNDILFIDSSHVVKIGSDLTTLLFSIIPSLQKGVIIHFHDIGYPWEYPEQMVKEGQLYNEIYFIRAFLQYNKSFEVLFFNSFVEKIYKNIININMPDYLKDSGKSLWLRKIT